MSNMKIALSELTNVLHMANNGTLQHILDAVNQNKVSNLDELVKLSSLLAEKGIPFECQTFFVAGELTVQICSPSIENMEVDAVSHSFSYGGKDGLIEVMGSVNPNKPNYDVVGYLTAEEAIEYFMNEDEDKRKRTYIVHVGLRYTANWKIEASSEEEALEKAELSVEDVESPTGFEFSDDDYDIIGVV